MTHEVMLDTETLALTSRAAVWQVGICNLDLENLGPGLFHTDYESITEKADAGRLEIDPLTVEWTRTYGDVENFALWETDESYSLSIHAIHAQLSRRIDRDTHVWCKNAAFDIPILTHLFSLAGLSTPWDRRNVNCMYTVTNLLKHSRVFGDVAVDCEKLYGKDWRAGGHNAARDCIIQAKELNVMRKLIWIE